MERDRGFLLLLIAALFVVSVSFVLPFLEYFLLAVLLAYILTPVQTRLERQVGPRTSASLIVLGAAVTILVPLVFVLQAALAESRRLINAVREGDVTFEGIETWLVEQAGFQVDISESLRSGLSDVGPDAFGSLLGLVEQLAHVTIGLGLALFLLYYFLKDRGRFMAWLRDVCPLPGHVQDELYAEIDSIMWAVLAGHVFVAIIQGVIAGLGLFAVGIPNALFWTVVMVVLALLPIVGSFLVWGPAVAYLAIGGRPVAAAALFVYGAIVVGVSDDYLRPIVVDRYAELNPSVIIIGVLGGIYVIGFMGIFFGPILIGSLKAALDVLDGEYDESGT